ncbi:MAG: hypothetical protein PVH88_15095 [Ignavibacteria bacterium]
MKSNLVTKLVFHLFLTLISSNTFAQVPTEGLIGHWPFTGNYYDVIANNNGIPSGNNAPQFINDRGGTNNTALYFEYSKLILPYKYNFSNSSFTIGFWVNFASTIFLATGGFSQKNPVEPFNGVFLGAFHGGNWKKAELIDINGNSLSVPTNSASNWDRYEMVYDNNTKTLYLYVDGVMQGSDHDPNFTGNFGEANHNNPTFMSDGEIYCDGNLDDVRIYNRALNANEIQQLYLNSGLTYTVNPSAYSGGSITPAAPLFIDKGESITITAQPNQGYVFDYFTYNGTQITENPYTISNVQSNIWISASFIHVFTVTPSVNPPGWGTIEPSTPVTVQQDGNSGVTFTATANVGYKFHSIYVNDANGNQIGSSFSPSYTVYPNSNTTITATFDIYRPKLQFVYEYIKGSVSPPPHHTYRTIYVDYGQDFTFTGVPNEGYEFDYFIIDNTDTLFSNPATLSNITEDHTINVLFKETLPVYTVTTWDNGSGGSIVPSGEIEVLEGSDVNLTIVYNTGYKIDSVLVNDEQVYVDPAQPNLTITNVHEDILVKAYFSLDEFFEHAITPSVNNSEWGSIEPSTIQMVKNDSLITLTATPSSPAYQFDYFVKLSNNEKYYDNPLVYGPVTFQAQIQAVFKEAEYNLTKWVNSPGMGSIVENTQSPYAYGSTAELFIVYNTNYKIDSVLVNSVQVYVDPSNPTLQITNIAEDIIVKAYFSYDDFFEHAITPSVNNSEWGSIEPSTLQMVKTDSMITFTATPSSRAYEFDHFLKLSNNEKYYDNPLAYGPVTFQAQIQAVFAEAEQFNVNLTSNPPEGGTLSKEPDPPYYLNDLITITAVPNENYIFKRWEENNTEISTLDQYEFNITGDRDFTAIFASTYNITLNVEDALKGTIVPSGVEAIEAGEDLIIEASATRGYEFDYFLIDQTTTEEDNPFTLSSISADHEVTAYFKDAVEQQIGISAMPEGESALIDAITVSLEEPYYFGDELTIEADEVEGFTFIKWTIDGLNVSTESTYNFAVTGDMDLVAVYSGNARNVVVTISPENSGTIESGEGSHEYGSYVEVKALANSGYSFDYFLINNDPTHITDNPFVIESITSDYSIEAHFAETYWERTGNDLVFNRENGRTGIGIAVSQIPQDVKLAVGGTIICEEAEVKLSEDWPDYVFNNDYKLMSLDKLRDYIFDNGHLPGIPNAKEVNSNGFESGKMCMKLLKKVEELTLYVIAKNNGGNSIFFNGENFEINQEYENNAVGDEEVSFINMTLSGEDNWRINGDDMIYNGGKIGIGVTASQIPAYSLLAVGGKILAEEIVIKNRDTEGNWPDYVFNRNHNLMSLIELKKYILEYGKLPGIPGAKEVEREGIKVGEMSRKLLEKIEELTLYVLGERTVTNKDYQTGESVNKLFFPNEPPLETEDISSQDWEITENGLTYTDGNVIIGTDLLNNEAKLAVDGKIITEEMVVKLSTDWPDYVFKSDYKLMSLDELEEYLIIHKHLPGIPSAGEVEENGLSLGEIQAKLLEKIEELTLYIVEQDKKINELENKLEKLSK